MHNEVTLTSKGQATIPKNIRDSLYIKAGDQLIFKLMSDSTVVVRLKNKSMMRLAGSLYKKGRKPLSLEKLSL